MNDLVTIDPQMASQLAAMKQELGLDDDFVLGGGGDFLPYFSLNGKRFTPVVDGQPFAMDGEPPSELKVIVVAASKTIGRVWFDKPYTPGGDAAAPACWSQDGEAPDQAARLPQAQSCASCPQNVVGSGPNGVGRACSFVARLVVWEPHFDKLFTLFLKGGSLFRPDHHAGWSSYTAYTKALEQIGAHPALVRTHISFVPEESVPILRFKVDGPASKEAVQHAITMWKELPEQTRETAIVPVSVATSAAVAPQQAAPASQGFGQPAQQPAPQQAAPAMEPQQSGAVGWDDEIPF